MVDRIILTYSGPMVGQSFLFVVVNLLVFLVTLILVLRIGSGRIAGPILVIGFGFLTSAVLPLVWGSDVFWLVPLIQSFCGFLGILFFMQVLGIFSLFNKK